MLDDTGDSFPAVYRAVKSHLLAMETDDNPFYQFTRDTGGETSLTVRFPEVTLDLMDKITPQTVTRPAYELPKILALISETEPALVSDRRYTRLIDLVSKA